MTGTTSRYGLLLACVWLTQLPATKAQDWPQWRGPNRDNVLTGFKIPSQWPKELTQKWTVKVGLGDASPSLAGDKVFVFARQDDQETMMAIDALSGKMLWQEQQPAVAVTGGPRDHPGPRSTPVVYDGKVYALGVSGLFTCWDANTGKVIWRKDSKEFEKQWPQFFTSMSPVVVDQLCIAHLGAEANGALVACDTATGQERWRWAGDGPSYGSPVVATIGDKKQVVLETAKSVVGVDIANGNLLWQHPLKGQPTGTPVVDGNTVYYTAQGTHAIRIEKKGDAWNVEQLWSKATPAPRYTTPVLKNGHLYGAVSTGNLYCMDAKTGEFLWTDTVRRGDPTAVLDAGPVLLTVSSNGELAAFEPNPKECVEVAKIKLGDSPVWAYPVLSGNRVYIKDKESLTLWTLE